MQTGKPELHRHLHQGSTSRLNRNRAAPNAIAAIN
jgi:hypothetical protein